MSDLGEVEAAVGGRAPGRPRRPGHRDPELRHQPPHDDGRPARRRRHQPGRARRRRGRRELWPRTGRDGGHRRAARPRRGPTGVLVVAQSNAGLPQLGRRPVRVRRPARRSSPTTPGPCSELGVDLIGACCGSTPAHTAAMGRALSAWTPQDRPRIVPSSARSMRPADGSRGRPGHRHHVAAHHDHEPGARGQPYLAHVQLVAGGSAAPTSGRSRTSTASWPRTPAARRTRRARSAAAADGPWRPRSPGTRRTAGSRSSRPSRSGSGRRRR